MDKSEARAIFEVPYDDISSHVVSAGRCLIAEIARLKAALDAYSADDMTLRVVDLGRELGEAKQATAYVEDELKRQNHNAADFRGQLAAAQETIEALKRNCEIERETFEKDQAQIAELKTMNDTLWRALSPERRHEINLQATKVKP